MVLLATRLRRQLLEEAAKNGVAIVVKLKNITLNGIKRGCSGHIFTEDSCVYLTTEAVSYIPLRDKAMYRIAEGPDDYSSNRLVNGNNRWCNHSELAAKVVETLKNEKPLKR